MHFSYILIPDVPWVPIYLSVGFSIFFATRVPILTALVARGIYLTSPTGLYITEQQSPAANTSSLLVLMYSSIIIAPFFNVSSLSFIILVLGANPMHNITKSAS